MMTFDVVRQLVADSVPDALVVREFLRATHLNSSVNEFGPGLRLAGETLSSFRVRQEASRVAGLDEVGLDLTIQELELLGAYEPILLFHWSTGGSLFTALVCERTSGLVGFVRAHSRTVPE